MGQPADIDRLIELGLNRYGAGDLDGALLMWEEALAIDPDNAQANSYVDYVRQNYELLTSGEPAVEPAQDAPFAIEEEPEYLIEVIPGRPSEPSMPGVTLPPAAELVSLDVDSGWDVEETHDTSAVFSGNQPPPDDDALAEPPEPAREPVNFEDATREYHGVVQKASQPILPMPGDFSLAEPTHDQSAQSEFSTDEFTGGFNNSQGTPIGFASQETEVRKRDLGFVQPTAKPAEPAEPASNDTEDLELGHFEATQERSSRYASANDDDGGNAPGDDDLIESLPRPRPLESGEIILPPKSNTRDMPQSTRQPARLDSSALSQAEVMLPHAPTRELTPHEQLARTQPVPTSAPTRELPKDLRAAALEPLISAPTRELGLRPGGRPLANPTDEDAPTGQTDVRAIRAAASRNDGGAGRAEGTRHDIVLPFDPIAAQAAQILEDVDAGAPTTEPADDRTRRRITRLLELAGDWNDAGEVDKAVSAVDLALSEDPNSALGQKLITRNKDLIMSLFQSYLGNLDRMPQLARPLHELANAPISPRAAFLLSRIDGTLTIDELLDVSGMPRLEAYRHICQLYLRGILR